MISLIEGQVRIYFIIREGGEKMKPRIRSLLTIPLVSLFAFVVLVFAGSTAGAQTFKVWHGYTQPERIAVMEKIAHIFESEHPGIKVELTVVPWKMYPKRWPPAFAAGNLPDVMSLLPEVALSMWIAGALLPCDEVIEALGGPENMFGLAKKYLFYEGHWIGVPHYGHSRILYYRKDRFREAGLEAPVSWGEFLDAAIKTTNPPKYYGFVLYLSKTDWYGAKDLWTLMGGQLEGEAGEYFDKEGNINFNTPETIRAVKLMVELYKKAAPEGSLNYDGTAQYKVWTSGLTTMQIAGAGRLYHTYRDMPEVYKKGGLGFAHIPVEALPHSHHWASLLSLGRTVNSKNPELANEFLKLIHRPDLFLEFAHSMPSLIWPVLKTEAQDPSFYEAKLIKENRLHGKLILHGMEGSEAGYKYGPNPYAYILYGGIIEEMFHRIILENVPVEKAVAATQAELERKLAEAKRR